jgi:hypothetical protein
MNNNSLCECPDIEDIDTSKFSFVLNKNLPDKNTEVFWYGFKENIINMINNIKHKTEYQSTEHQEHFKFILKDLENKSNKFNILQKEEKFIEINNEIECYIKWISRNFIIQYANDYYFNIYLTNLKRWSKTILEIPDKIRFDWLEENKNENENENKNKTQDYFMIFFNLRKYLCEHNNTHHNKIEDTVFIDIFIDVIKKYTTKIMIKNKILLDEIYKMIIDARYMKPSILIEFGKYYPIIKDLQKIGYIKQNIPENFSIEKALKKCTVNVKSHS